MEVKITFSSGEIIAAEQNGGSFITEQKPGFPTDMGLVTVEGADGIRTYSDPQVVECASVDGRYWFCFVEESPQEKCIRQLAEENEILAGAVEELAAIIGEVNA